MATLGPNTNAPVELLSADCIYVAGEDRSHVLSLLPEGAPSFRHRGYEFWKQPNFTMILSGMGTGCVEPLVWEITQPGVVRRIVLVGTAGKMPAARVDPGSPHAVTEAFLAGTGLDGENIAQPLRPRWELPNEIATASSVSTDFFYGFAPRLLDGGYPLADGDLRRKYEEHVRRGTQLVEMEVAAFYCFCERFGDGDLRYVAVKGASNELGADSQQLANSGGVIDSCFRVAQQLMR